MLDDHALALRYAPHFYADKNEPFDIALIGYSIHRAPCVSPTFNRTIKLPEGVAFVIEYAVYFDYDITHLYDLEHVWVYVGHDGRIINGESSAHGWYWNCKNLGGPIEDDTHLPIYLQPGKHAMLAYGDLSKLFTNYIVDCNELAGKDGLLVPDMLKHRIPKDDQIDALVHQHIQANFRFSPTLIYHHRANDPSIMVTAAQLLEEIPVRINALIEKLKQEATT